MRKSNDSNVNWKVVRFVGIDLGNARSKFCALGRDGKVVARGTFPTEPQAFENLIPLPCRVAIEVGTHSPWISRVLEAAGHELYIANPRKVRLIFASGRKSDRLDAENLARLVRVDPTLLHPIRHRSEGAQADLAVIKARQALVELRTKLINTVRGLCKSQGSKLPACSSPSFPNKVREHVPEVLRPAIQPLLDQLTELTRRIREYDDAVDKLANEKYPETSRLTQVNGVGMLTALAFVLTLDDKQRFRRSRQVGAWLGLTRKIDESGESEKRLGITKQGNEYMRQLLVNCAHYILGPFGTDCELRRFGLRIAESGGPHAKKRAVTAVARKLAVLLHKLWVSGEEYIPLGYAAERWGKDAA